MNLKEFIVRHVDLIGAVLVAFLAPIYPLLFSVGFLILADLVTGVWAAKKRGECFSKSAAWRRTISKIAVYNVAIVSGFLVETTMLAEFLPISKIVGSVIGLVELKSILENCNSILGQNLFKLVIQKLGSENDNLKQQIKDQVQAELDKQLK